MKMQLEQRRWVINKWLPTKVWLILDVWRYSFILYDPYHGCRWPGDKRSEDISNRDIEPVWPEYSAFSARTGVPYSGFHILNVAITKLLFLLLNATHCKYFFESIKKPSKLASISRERNLSWQPTILSLEFAANQVYEEHTITENHNK